MVEVYVDRCISITEVAHGAAYSGQYGHAGGLSIQVVLKTGFTCIDRLL